MLSFEAGFNWLRSGLSAAFRSTSTLAESESSIRRNELADVQAAHDFTSIHIENCFDPSKPSFSGPETLLKLLQEFFVTYKTPLSAVNTDVHIPILHNKSFKVFFRLQENGYEPVGENQENQDSSAAGIVEYAVAVAMRDMQKFAGMRRGSSYDSKKMYELGDKMLEFRAQYLRQHKIENPAPGVPQA